MVTLFTLSHKRPDFIRLQYESIKKHVKCEYEFIVLNNAIDSLEQRKTIEKTCKELGIKSINVELIDDLRFQQGEACFTGNQYKNPNLACSYPLIWLFNKFITNEKIVCIIDSDMFFINDIDLEHCVKDQDILYIPQYRNNNQIHYIWNAFVIFNFERNPLLKTINWHPGHVNGIPCDVGGQNHFDLIRILPKVDNYIEEYSIYDIKNKVDSIGIEYIQNGNINYDVELFHDHTIKSITHRGGDPPVDNKSFPHEIRHENLKEYVYKRTVSILELLENFNVNLPDPKHIGFIGFAKEKKFFILHYKSGSNYLSFSTKDYNDRKTFEIMKILGVEK